MRRRRRRISRSDPLPPGRRFYRVDLPFQQSKTPLQMTTFVSCYGQGAQRQSLARVAQTRAVRMAGMTLGGRACDVPGELWAGCARYERGRAVIVYNLAGVTHLFRVRTIFAARFLFRHPAHSRHSLRRTHAPIAAPSLASSARTRHPRPHAPTLPELRTHTHARFSLLILSFLLPSRYA